MEIEKQKNQDSTDTPLIIDGVTNRYLFFYEGEEDGWTFEVIAKNFEKAFDLAYETHGPQVEDMYYRQL